MRDLGLSLLVHAPADRASAMKWLVHACKLYANVPNEDVVLFGDGLYPCRLVVQITDDATSALSQWAIIAAKSEEHRRNNCEAFVLDPMLHQTSERVHILTWW